MISRVLVANRAEIASRVFRTCRRLGIETVAVHSDADAGLPFVREADHAVRLPGDAPTDTYLRADLLLDAARRTGADAIHPGYGFLSENADFARAVIAAGLTWIGPTPESIEQMGSKVEAKKLMEAAGVPVLGNLTADTATEADLPLLVKASAGGGGRGMRVVRALADLPGDVERASAEAESAFGDGTVFVEPYVEHGRHVEVQVVGDGHGGVQVFGERDCSLQRRHQKVVEETPAPGLPGAVRTAMHGAARAAAEAISYRGAGTVEFLYDSASERFFFLEMNTRLQVEHPVTELVHGVDLVEMQLAVAEGWPLMAGPAGTTPDGHAIEVRLYAEDPAADYQPQSGRLTLFKIPVEPGVRVDAGFATGDEVTTHYDAMLAKVVVHAPTRRQAARQLAGVLRRARIHGVRTNRDQLVAVLRHPRFLDEDVSTSFLAGHPEVVESLPSLPGSVDDQAVTCFAAAMALVDEAADRRPVQRGIPAGWRNVVSAPQVATFDVRGTEVQVGWLADRAGTRFVDPNGEVAGVRLVVVVPDGDDRVVTVDHDGVRTTHRVRIDADAVDVDSPWGHVALRRLPRFVDPAEAVASGSLLAPMPGTVVSVAVATGDEVAAGQPVLVLEAMKMQHTVSAPHAGVVTEIDVEPGRQVAAGEVLAVVSGDEAEEQA